MKLPAFRLHVTPAEGSPFDFAFLGESVVVGRAVDAGLSIADPFLSRRHSRFFRAGILKLVCLGHRTEACAAVAAALDRDLLAFVRGTPFADDRTVVLARWIA